MYCAIYIFMHALFPTLQKKSREESSGAGSGVEIIVNEPYQDGPGGNGQYTRKIYHVGSHLPGWIKGLLPKSALTVEEEAWNAYPYTKTRYTCPFVEKFSLEIETYYFPDKGHQDNVFKLSGADLRNRIVDLIDIVKDQLYGADYTREEDPTVYCSERTGRGPLSDCWLDEHWEEVQGKQQPTARNMSLMCAYKLCRVEFRYWGMQTKLEKFIHDTALRKTMLRAHRQAWAWQDEWYGLSMDDIREIERQTQLALQRKMGNEEGGNEQDGEGEEGEGKCDAAGPAAVLAGFGVVIVGVVFLLRQVPKRPPSRTIEAPIKFTRSKRRTKIRRLTWRRRKRSRSSRPRRRRTTVGPVRADHTGRKNRNRPPPAPRRTTRQMGSSNSGVGRRTMRRKTRTRMTRTKRRMSDTVEAAGNLSRAPPTICASRTTLAPRANYIHRSAPHTASICR